MNNRGSFMTMAVIFLWPRWGVRSYPIVTRVTSDVGIPSTRLVDIHNCRIYSHWLSIPNQIVIAGYLAVAEYQICFHFIVWVVRSRPHMNVSNSFFIIMHGDMCKLYYWIWTLYMASRRTSCILFEFTYIYIWKQATHSVGCRFINIYCTVPGGMCSLHLKFILLQGLISWTIYNIAVRAASTLCKPQANIYIKKIAEMECRHFDKIFITDCSGRQLPVQPVMKVSSKWYFRFSARASWIILTFRADLVHVYITCCGHVYSYKIKYTSSM